MPLITKQLKSGAGEMELEYFPAHLPNGAVVADFRVNKPGSPQDGLPYNVLQASTIGPGLLVSYHYPLSIDGAEALIECLTAATEFLKNPPPPEPPQEPLPDVMPVELSPYSQNIPEAGGNNYTFTVTSTGVGINNTWMVDMDGSATWITLQSPPLHIPQTAPSGTVTYSVNRNSAAARTANFYVNGKTFVVSQDLGLVEDVTVPPPDAPVQEQFSAEPEKKWFDRGKKK